MSSTKTIWLSRLLWIDGFAGLVVGLFVLSFHAFLANVYGLPQALVWFIGVANVFYSSIGLTLAVRKPRAVEWIVTLAAANLVWTCVCIVLMVQFASVATPFGLAMLGLEGVFVAVLASFEWRYRTLLTGRTVAAPPK
jgi:hypothetical protein